MTIKLDNDFIHFHAPHSVGAELNAVYSKARGVYRLPYTLGALRELHQLGYPDALSLGIQLNGERQKLLLEKQVQAKNVDSRLRPYQREDVNFLIQKDSLASFSEMRTGKTPTMVQVLQQRGVKSIVICPASLTHTWVDEIHKWSSLRAETVGKSTPKARQVIYDRFRECEFDVLVVSKDTSRTDVNELMGLGSRLLAIDEAHFLRNYKTGQSNAVYRLAAGMKYRYALTGTPATNKPDDVYGILRFLRPQAYPSYWQFVERYFVVADSPFGRKVGNFKSPQRKREFHEIIEEISVQRKRKDVMQWLPPKQYQTVELEMGKKQAKAYQDMFEMFEIEDTEITAPSILAQLTRLRQLTVAPSMLKLDIPSVKEEFILEWLADHPDEQVVIFSNFTSYLKELKKKLRDAEMIVGETTQKARKDHVKKFQAGKTKIILANIQAAGTGLTLDAAGTVIFLDRAYTPTDNQQAEDRIIATTQESNQAALIIDLVCKGSVDEKILKMVKKKQNITQIVNDYKSVKDFISD